MSGTPTRADDPSTYPQGSRIAERPWMCLTGFGATTRAPEARTGPPGLTATSWRPGQFLKRGQKVTMRWLDAGDIA